MSRVLAINEVCERALRKIGAFAIRSSGARPEEMAEARDWLDMLVGHQAARQRTWWLIPATANFTITAGIASYDLNKIIGTTVAPDGFEFIVSVFLYDPVMLQDRRELGLLRRLEFEAIEDKTTPGEPTHAYISRDQKPTITLIPPPDSANSYVARVVYQKYPQDFTSGAANQRLTAMRTAWNLWMVTALAAQIANGPVRKLPADEVADMKKEAETLRNELEAYEAHEHANEPRRVRFYNF